MVIFDKLLVTECGLLWEQNTPGGFSFMGYLHLHGLYLQETYYVIKIKSQEKSPVSGKEMEN